MEKFDYIKNKQHLADVYQETIKAVLNGKYTAPDGTVVELGSDREMRENSRFYSRRFTVRDIPAHKEPTKVELLATDSISAGKQLLDEGYNPVVLNFANAFNPGGGVINGSRAQEESLFRCTNLFRSLYQYKDYAEEYGVEKSSSQYPLDLRFGGVYTPYATVFRESKGNSYEFLAHPFKLSFIAVAALRRFADREMNLKPMTDSEIDRTLSKMRTIFRIGLYQGHDALVLGAFGCGAFKNPPSLIAELFKKVMDSPEFRNKYRKIVFAVFDDHNSLTNGVSNYDAFKEVFG